MIPDGEGAHRGIAKPSKRDTQMSANLTIPNVLTPNEVASTICDRLFDGETLSEICRDAAMPDRPTMMRWLEQDPKFLDEYVFTFQLLAEEAVSVVGNADTECRNRVRGAKIVTVSGREQFARRRRLRLARRHRVADRLIRKTVPRALRNRKEVS